MNPIHLHLLLNHIPILAVIFGLLVMIFGFLFKNQTVKYVALGFFILAALMAVPANQSGESAEDAVENIQGVDHQLIEVHEDATKPFFIGTLILGGISLLTLWFEKKRKTIAGTFYIPISIMALVLCVVAIRAGNSGGQIRRPELRNGASSIQMPVKPPESNDTEDKD